MEKLKNKCANYDKELECCKIYSDWSGAMPVLQLCIESPCKYFKQYTNYDRIKSMSVEEMAEFLLRINNIGDSISSCQNKNECNEMLDNDEEITEEMCSACMKQWLLQEASDK